MKTVLKFSNILFSWLIPVLLLISIEVKAQTSIIESLRVRYYSTTLSDDEKRETVIQLCEQYFSLPADSLLKYVNKGLLLFPEDSPSHFRMKNFYCYYLFKTGKSTEAISLTDSLLSQITSVNNPGNLVHEVMANRGMALIRTAKNKEAIEQAFSLLESAEKMHDTLYVVKACNLLGWANMEMEKYAESAKWLNRGIHYTANKILLQKVSSLFSNNASSYNNLNKKDSAFYFIDLAFKYSSLSENLTIRANAFSIRASMYLKAGNYAAAEKDLKDAVEVRKQIGDPLYILSDMAQLSAFYAMVDQTEKGIAIAKEGIEFATKINNKSKLLFLNYALSANYEAAGRMEEFAATLNKIIQLKDSLYKQNSEEAIAALEAKYEFQKKENIIIQQKYDLVQSRYMTLGVIALFLFAALLVMAYYRNYKQVQKRKMLVIMEEQKKIAEEAVLRAEENERKRIAADLHDNLGSYAAAITSNIRYLKEGNNGEVDAVISQLDENAHDIVTQLSDTIWVLKNENLAFTRLADRFKVWIMRLMQNYPGIKYHYAENISEDLEFTPAKILHIFLMLKECVNNALKHSNCSDLSINFSSGKDWKIVIEDNGKGLNRDNYIAGCGLENIMKRAKECGCSVTWENVVPSGTRIIIAGTTK